MIEYRLQLRRKMVAHTFPYIVEFDVRWDSREAGKFEVRKRD